MNINGLGRGQAASASAGRGAALGPDEAEAWRKAMLNQILTQIRKHEPQVNQAAQQAKSAFAAAPEPEAARPPRKGSLVNCYV